MKAKFVIGSIIVGILFALVFSEIIIRLFAHRLPDSNWERALFCRNARLNYRFMKPGVSGYQSSFAFPAGVKVEANAHGYRDIEWAEKQKTGKKPVLLLGDSFGWGWGCHQDSTIARFIEAQRQDRVVYNLCIPGDNLFRIHLRYRYHADQIGAQHVVIMNYINDFFDILDQQRQMRDARAKNLYAQNRGALIECDTRADAKLTDVLNHSHLFRYVNRTRNSFRFSTRREKGRKLLDSLFRIGFAPDVDLMTDTTYYGEIRTFYREILREISAQRQVTVVHIPPDYQVDAERRREIERLFPGKVIRPELINGLLRDAVSGLPNVSLLDVTDAMRKENERGGLYIKLDGHLNERGQRFIGESIAGHLSR